MRLKLALIVVGLFAAIAVTGASAADFDHDERPVLTKPPGEGLLGRCPTGYVGAEYEIEIESEEGSGCEPYDYFEIDNSALPPGLSMTRDGVISGVPTSAGSLALLGLGSRPDLRPRRARLVRARGQVGARVHHLCSTPDSRS